MLTRSRSRSTEGDSEQCSSSQSQSSSQATDSAPQDVYIPKKKGRSLNRKRPAHVAQWMCIMPENGNGQYDSSFLSLRDPKTGCLRRYLMRRPSVESPIEECDLCEVMKISDEPRSWFIDNTIQTDGSMYMCTPVDALFIVLPYLMTAAKSGKFTTMSAILDDSMIDCSRMLEKCVRSDQWKHVTDTKELSNGMKVFKYSWEKTREWLKAKVETLAVSLEKEGVYVGTGSLCSSLVRSSKQKSITKADYFKYACGLVSDYLPKDLSDKLAEDYPSLNIPTQTPGKHKREADSNGETNGAPPTKKGRSYSNNSEPSEDYTKFNSKATEPKQATSLTSAQKALAKVDKTGMKSISSFFSTKPKK